MIRIYGASDDLVEIEGDFEDEVSPKSTIIVGTTAAGVRVRMRYDADGCWRATVGQVGEYAPIPWPVTISEAPISGTNEGAYSAMVTIDCPPGTPVFRGTKRLNPEQRR